MPDSTIESVAAVPAATNPLWKAPTSIADTQKPIKLETTDFDSNFIPYEIEYGVVMDQLSKIYKSWKSTIREYIANAESACMAALKLDPNYKPEIKITYNPEHCLLTIEDNGIGLSRKMFMEVFRYFGRSRNAFDPTISGMFGLGAKSFVMLVGDKGSMVLHTRSRETDECYKMYARKVGFDVLPNEDRGYGTSFTFVHDPGFNKLQVIKAIGDYSRYVRVPVNFTITGSPVTVENTDREYPHTNQPDTVILKPSGPTTISMVSPELVLDAAIEKSLKTGSTHYHSGGESRDFIKLHFETEHYDFWGLIEVDPSNNCLALRNNEGSAWLLLISMPTEEVKTELFSKAVIRIKSETGPVWLPKPTPDRERFEDKSREAFLDQLSRDLAQILPTLKGVSKYCSNHGTSPAVREFAGIGKIDSFTDFFKLSETQQIIWREIHQSSGRTCRAIKEALPPATAAILDTLFREVEYWDTSERSGWGRRRRRSSNRELFEPIETALDNSKKIYIAPPNAKRSASMRNRAVTAHSNYDIVLLSPLLASIPLALTSEIPVFHDLSEIKLEKKEKIHDRAAFHEVEIDPLTQNSKRSSEQKLLTSIAGLERNRAVAIGTEANINDYIELLERPTHTCPVGVFKASQQQIRWLADNSKILSLKEYVAWAKKQELSTSKGKLTLGFLLSHYSTFFHSIGEAAGLRLLNHFKNCPEITYVPLTDEDYFMAAAVLKFTQPKQAASSDSDQARTNSESLRQKRIGDSDALAEYLHLKLEREYGDWYLDHQQERKGLMIYSLLALEDGNDHSAIEAVYCKTPIRDLVRIIDCMVKLRQTTTRHKSKEAKPEALGEFFRMAI